MSKTTSHKNLGQQEPPHSTLSNIEVDLEGIKMSKKHHRMPARKCSECGMVLGKDYPYDLCPRHFISNYGYAPKF